MKTLITKDNLIKVGLAIGGFVLGSICNHVGAEALSKEDKLRDDKFYTVIDDIIDEEPKEEEE